MHVFLQVVLILWWTLLSDAVSDNCTVYHDCDITSMQTEVFMDRHLKPFLKPGSNSVIRYEEDTIVFGICKSGGSISASATCYRPSNSDVYLPKLPLSKPSFCPKPHPDCCNPTVEELNFHGLQYDGSRTYRMERTMRRFHKIQCQTGQTRVDYRGRTTKKGNFYCILNEKNRRFTHIFEGCKKADA